jgi:hypothetical protein
MPLTRSTWLAALGAALVPAIGVLGLRNGP